MFNLILVLKNIIMQTFSYVLDEILTRHNSEHDTMLDTSKRLTNFSFFFFCVEIPLIYTWIKVDGVKVPGIWSKEVFHSISISGTKVGTLRIKFQRRSLIFCHFWKKKEVRYMIKRKKMLNAKINIISMRYNMIGLKITKN